MKGLIVLLCVAILAAVTKPDSKAHYEMLGEEVCGEKEGDFGSLLCEGLLNLGGMAGEVDFDDKVFFTTVAIDGDLATVGVFGMVFAVEE